MKRKTREEGEGQTVFERGGVPLTKPHSDGLGGVIATKLHYDLV